MRVHPFDARNTFPGLMALWYSCSLWNPQAASDATSVGPIVPYTGQKFR